MRRPIVRPEAILFDCDGVIADSEGIIARVLAEEITTLGWPMTVEEERTAFQGMTGPMLNELLVNRLGPLPEGWRERVDTRIRTALANDLQPVPGIVAALRLLREAGLTMAVASNSGRLGLSLKIGRLGLAEFFEGGLFSYQDVAAPKPAPDLYLAAAAACGAPPSRCVVVEDTAMGARAGVAAGCRVLGYVRHEAPGMADTGAELFRDMAELPALLGYAPANVREG